MGSHFCSWRLTSQVPASSQKSLLTSILVYYIILHNITLRYVTLHYITLYILLYFILTCILRYVTLHYIILYILLYIFIFYSFGIFKNGLADVLILCRGCLWFDLFLFATQYDAGALK